MLDQASKLRQMAIDSDFNRNLNLNNTRVFTITSGKGGVGKSNIVVNLAISLRKLGKKVLILDADLGMGNDDVLLGTIPKHNIFDAIFSGKDIEEIMIEGPLGIKLVSGGSALSKIDDLTEVQRQIFLKKLENIKGFDYILIDTGAGVNRTVMAFIACSDELIIVTTPEPTALTDGYSLLKTVNHYNIKKSAKVIINKVLDKHEGTNTFNKFDNAAQKFLGIRLNFLGEVSEDRKLVQAVRMQKPVSIAFPSSESSKDIDRIAKNLDGVSYRTSGEGMQSLFKKIFNIFS